MTETPAEETEVAEERWLLSSGGQKLHKPVIINGTPRASCDQKTQLSVERTDEGDQNEETFEKCSRCSTPVQERKPVVPNQPRFDTPLNPSARYTF